MSDVDQLIYRESIACAQNKGVAAESKYRNITSPAKADAP
jgi:hypothetical protein